MFAPLFGQEFMDGAYWSIVLELIFYGWVFLLLAFGLFDKACERIILCWLLISLVNELLLGMKPLRLLLLTEYSGFFAAGILIYRLRAGRSGIAALPLLALRFAFSLRSSIPAAGSSRKITQTEYSAMTVAAGCHWHVRTVHGGDKPCADTASGAADERGGGAHLSALSHPPAYRLHRHHPAARGCQRYGDSGAGDCRACAGGWRGLDGG